MVLEYAQTNMVPVKELEIPSKLNVCFSDMHELREQLISLTNKLEPVMASVGPKPLKEPAQKVASDPLTTFGAQLTELDFMINHARELVAEIFDRLEI